MITRLARRIREWVIRHSERAKPAPPAPLPPVVYAKRTEEGGCLLTFVDRGKAHAFQLNRQQTAKLARALASRIEPSWAGQCPHLWN